MPNQFGRALAVLTTALLAASCTSMQYTAAWPANSANTPSLAGKHALRALPYFLPDTVLPVTVKGDFVAVSPAVALAADPTNLEYQLSVTVGAPAQVADPSAPYLLTYDLNGFTDDVHALTVGANGLLTTSNGQSTDETAQILAQAASSAIQIAGGGGVLGARLVGPAAAAQPTDAQRRTACFNVLQKFQYDGVINLSEGLENGWTGSAEFQHLNDAIQVMMVKSGVVPAGSAPMLAPSDMSAFSLPAPDPLGLSPDKPHGEKGIVFRMFVPEGVRMDLDQGNGFSAPDAVSGFTCTLRQPKLRAEIAPTMIADRKFTFIVDTGRTALVAKTVNLTVTNGMFTSITVNKPSEVLAGVKLPLTVLNAITSAVLGNLTNRTTLVNDQSALIQAELGLIAQQEALAEKKKEQQGTP